MQTLAEKRVFGEKLGTTDVFVATETGLVVVTVSADQIGEFGLAYRGAVADVAVGDGRVALATDSDVLVRKTGADDGDEAFASTDFGAAVAVGLVGSTLLAADPDGTVAQLVDDRWTPLGSTAGVRAIDGSLVAAADGVYRLGEDLTYAGLDAARDVAGHGVPLAATDGGLYTLGNGWMDVLDGRFDIVASDGHDHAHAAGPDGLFVRDGDEWTKATLPVDESPIDIAYGAGLVAAVTRQGTLCVSVGDGWRHQLLGLRGTARVAVGAGAES
ncbi:HVO_0234 family beta-propeller protein [Haloferacaceae archaeon DSL9]